MAIYEVTVKIKVEADDEDQAFMQVGNDVEYLFDVCNDDEHLVGIIVSTDVIRVSP